MADQDQNPTTTKLALSPDVTFIARDVGGRTAFVAHHRSLGKYFRFGAEERHIANLIGNGRTIQEICDQLESDGVAWQESEVVALISELVKHKIAIMYCDDTDDVSTSDRPAAAHAASPGIQSIQDSEKPEREAPHHHRSPVLLGMKFLSLIVSQRIPLLEGQPLAARLDRRIGAIFGARAIAVWTVLVLSATLIICGNWREFRVDVRSVFDPSIWPFLILIWLVTKVLHELGHAVAAHHHGVRVGRMGVMFFFCAPLAFVDVTDAWKLNNRFRRVQIALAGVYVELGVAAVCVLAWWILPSGFPRHLATQVFLVAGPATLLVNANPLLRLDGYYVLSDLLEIPNLRMHGRRQLSAILEKWLILIPPKPELLSGWRRPFATAHALASVMFQVVWMTGLIIGVSMWARGFGMILGISAALLWGIIPLGRWLHKIWFMDPPNRFFLNDKRKRLLVMSVLIGTCVQYLAASSSPLDRRVPIVVRYQDEQIARATADAFVHSVYVTRGQRVTEGDLLLELKQPELSLEREKTADDLALAERRAVQHRQNKEIALAAAESEQAASLRRRLIELDQQIEGLRVVAVRSGLITTPQIERLQGRYVRQGDELIRVSDPNEKELLAAVGERDVQAYQQAVGSGRPAPVRLRGGIRLAATPVSLRPRARRSLPHPAMSAVAGGPLPVKPSTQDDKSLQLVEPRLESVTPLDPLSSNIVSAGQLGTMTISDNRSLFVRLYDAVLPKPTQ